MSDGSFWPRICIVTPSYNQGKFIEETIRSVLLQGYPNLEYIVIDGGSTDGSTEVIEKYSRWIKYWVSEKDEGQSDAVNKGFCKATGKIYAYINSDDVYLSGAFSHVASTFGRELEKKRIIAFSGYSFYENGRVETQMAHTRPASLSVWLSSEYSLFQQGVFWTRTLHEAVGEFNQDLHFCFDKEFFLKAVFRYGKYYSDRERKIAKFRLHRYAKTSIMQDTMWDENRLIWGRISKDSYYKEILRREERGREYLHAMNGVFVEKNNGKALRELMRIAIKWPGNVPTRFFMGAVKRRVI